MLRTRAARYRLYVESGACGAIVGVPKGGIVKFRPIWCMANSLSLTSSFFFVTLMGECGTGWLDGHQACVQNHVLFTDGSIPSIAHDGGMPNGLALGPGRDGAERGAPGQRSASPDASADSLPGSGEPSRSSGRIIPRHVAIPTWPPSLQSKAARFGQPCPQQAGRDGTARTDSSIVREGQRRDRQGTPTLQSRTGRNEPWTRPLPSSVQHY